MFTHFFVFLSPKLLKFSEIEGVKFLARSSGSVKFLTNLMSAPYDIEWHGGIVLEPKNNK